MRDKKNGEPRCETKKKWRDKMRDKKKLGDKTQDKKNGETRYKTKKNGETRHKTKKNRETRREMKKNGETRRFMKKNRETRRETKKNGETRPRRKKRGDETQDNNKWPKGIKWSAVPLPCSTFSLVFMGAGRAAAPIEWVDFPFICLFFYPSVRPSVRSPLWAIQPGYRPSQPGLKPED